MSSLLSILKNDFWDLWKKAPAARRFLYGAGLLLIASGLFHVIVFLHEGGSWEGPVSWRKPILFGMSSGLTTLSMGWAMGAVMTIPWLAKLSWRNLLEGFYDYTFAGAILIEVALITSQTWRGVPSHFNQTTPLDTAIFYGMGFLILYVSFQILLLAVLSLGCMRVSRDKVLAVRAGLFLLVWGCALGFWAMNYGVARVQAGLKPEVYGDHGVMKFPHGLPIHGIQYLALQSWLMWKAGLTERWRVAWLYSGVIGLCLMTLYGLMQTLQGRGRFEFTWESGWLFGIAVVLFLLPFLAAGSNYLMSWGLTLPGRNKKT